MTHPGTAPTSRDGRRRDRDVLTITGPYWNLVESLRIEPAGDLPYRRRCGRRAGSLPRQPMEAESPRPLDAGRIPVLRDGA